MSANAAISQDANIPIDRSYLSAQLTGYPADLLVHYLVHGLEARLNPTRYFMTDWYAWQNPDWQKNHYAPYLHYLDVGRREGRDPSPFVDITRFRQMAGDRVPVDQIYELILEGHHRPALGVSDPESLVRAQHAFRASIEIYVHKMRPLKRPKPALVVLQAGAGSLAGRWFEEAGRDWDLMINYYDATGFVPGMGEYVLFQKGTKFSAMANLVERFAQIFSLYDHVMFLDDDIETSVDDLNRTFEICRSADLDLAQISLSADSSCNWTELFSRPNAKSVRDVSAVEIMMPIFSRQSLNHLGATFSQSISGFGLDLVWGKLASEAGARIAVIDAVVAAHRRAVDQQGGAYYTYLRRNRINAKAELWTMLESYDAARDLISS